jgi:hypothetical protein
VSGLPELMRAGLRQDPLRLAECGQPPAPPGAPAADLAHAPAALPHQSPRPYRVSHAQIQHLISRSMQSAERACRQYARHAGAYRGNPLFCRGRPDHRRSRHAIAPRSCDQPDLAAAREPSQLSTWPDGRPSRRASSPRNWFPGRACWWPPGRTRYGRRPPWRGAVAAVARIRRPARARAPGVPRRRALARAPASCRATSAISPPTGRRARTPGRGSSSPCSDSGVVDRSFDRPGTRGPRSPGSYRGLAGWRRPAMSRWTRRRAS